jgi:hypothetical protein
MLGMEMRTLSEARRRLATYVDQVARPDVPPVGFRGRDEVVRALGGCHEPGTPEGSEGA